MNEQPCYICGTSVELGLVKTYSDGSVSYPGLDEDGHAFCKPCETLAMEVEDEVAKWSSSEDRDLFVANAAAEGLRRGRLMAQPAKGEPCKERIYHRPGHQSSTPCRVTGPHEVHEAVYGEFNQFASWRTKADGKVTYSGVFDDPPPEPSED